MTIWSEQRRLGLAVARKTERKGTRSQAVWQPTGRGESGAVAAAAGLESDARAAAATSPSDLAVAVGARCTTLSPR